jgi:hypothetical protein
MNISWFFSTYRHGVKVYSNSNDDRQSKVLVSQHHDTGKTRAGKNKRKRPSNVSTKAE